MLGPWNGRMVCVEHAGDEEVSDVWRANITGTAQYETMDDSIPMENKREVKAMHRARAQRRRAASLAAGGRRTEF